MIISKVFFYAWRWIIKPVRAAAEQLDEKQNFWIGFWTAAIFGLLYAVAAFFLWLAGFLPSFTPIVRIADEDYYFWQTFFTIPWALSSWFIAGVAIHLWSRLFSREGSLASILGLLGTASVVPWFFFTLIPEIGILPIVGPPPPWPDWIDITRQIIPSLWMMALFFIAASKVYTTRWSVSLASAILGSAIFFLLVYLFLR